MMRFYGEQRRFYCGIDLHASKMYVCVLDEQGNVVLHRNLRTEPEALKRALAPYRASLVVGAECMFPGTGSPTGAGRKGSSSSSATRST
jgi:predicted NBD/HSP70 family sugar kinase